MKVGFGDGTLNGSDQMNYSQKNIEQLFKLIGSFPDQQYVQTSHFDFIKTKDSAWPNQLVNLKASKDEVQPVLDSIENDVQDGNIPSILMLNPCANASDLIRKIRQRNYKASAWYAMTHNLSSEITQRTIPDFRVTEVQDREVFSAWIMIVEAVLMGNKSLNTELFNWLLENQHCYFFLGLEKNVPVATSFLFVHESMAGVYLVSTSESHRKKGFGRAMTNQCLIKAKELGCTTVELQATELGKPVYERLGFEVNGGIDVFRIEKTRNNRADKQ